MDKTSTKTSSTDEGMDISEVNTPIKLIKGHTMLVFNEANS